MGRGYEESQESRTHYLEMLPYQLLPHPLYKFLACIHILHNPKIKILAVSLSHSKIQKVEEEQKSQQQPQPPSLPPEEGKHYEETAIIIMRITEVITGHKTYRGQQGSGQKP